MESYGRVLTRIEPETSFGCTTIYVYRPEQLDTAQVGFSISSDGSSLVADEDGAWRRNWLVIGYSDNGGNPLFIDTSQPGYPVYTAIVGQGRWDPEPVAVSLSGFAEALAAVAEIARDRENPVALERNPLTNSEMDRALFNIRQHNPDMDTAFWQILLGDS